MRTATLATPPQHLKYVCGDEDDDTVEGGTGADDLCGNGDADSLFGGGHADRLDHGDDAGDSNDGGLPNPGDECNDGVSDPNCSSTLSEDFCTFTE